MSKESDDLKYAKDVIERMSGIQDYLKVLADLNGDLIEDYKLCAKIDGETVTEKLFELIKEFFFGIVYKEGISKNYDEYVHGNLNNVYTLRQSLSTTEKVRSTILKYVMVCKESVPIEKKLYYINSKELLDSAIKQNDLRILDKLNRR